MAKQILLREPAREALLRGMQTVAEVVGATLGPKGQTVVLSRPMGAALITKDGVTVAKNISLPDPWENEGAKLIQEVAHKTNQEAGDGTTAATILTYAILKQGIRQITAGADPQAIERGIRDAVKVVVAELKSLAIPVKQSDVERLSAVATIAANGDTEMGSVIGRAISHAGVEGSYSLDEGVTDEMDLEIAEGLQFDRGLMDRSFATYPGGAVLSPCNIFVTDRRLIDLKETAQILQTYLAANRTVPLLIIAEDVEQGAKQTLVVNNGKVLQVCPVRTPGTGPSKKDELQDIAVYTGARAFLTSNGDEPANIKFEDLGSADRVLITGHRTTIVGGHGSSLAIEARKDDLRARISDPKTTEFDRAHAEKRLAALSSSIAVVKLGKSIHSKLLEKRDRAEDSINATRGALEEGIVPGGGMALLRCMPALRKSIESLEGDAKVGAQIIFQSLAAPLKKIADNSGANGEVVLAAAFDRFVEGSYSLSELNLGYDADVGGWRDMVAAGIVDPVKVIRIALQNSAELAGLLLTSAALVVDIPESKPPASPYNLNSGFAGGNR